MLRTWACALLVAAALAIAPPRAVAADRPSVSVPVMPSPAPGGEKPDESSPAAAVDLGYDFAFKRPASEATKVRIAQDASGVSISIDARQKAALTLSQRTNGSGVYNDDNVTVALWPQGTRGIAYTFTANALGARYQTSSENSDYAPEWSVTGAVVPGGYTVTMRIPFAIVRAGGGSDWSAQIVRTVVATGSQYVWAAAPNQTGVYDAANAGLLNGIAARSGAAQRPKPRLQVYVLDQIRAAGGTSRIGGDAAIPFAPTSSLLISAHPDFSNVEIDQQTIAPSAFPRQYQEVRPFFTQAAQNFNPTVYCNGCPQTLYTPAIPTYRSGVAVSGTEGLISYGAFDANGYGRSDAAAVASYAYQDSRKAVVLSAQTVRATIGGLGDATTTLASGYVDRRSHMSVWLNAGSESGSLASSSPDRSWSEYGTGYFGRNGQVSIDHLRIGKDFSPVDGYVAQNAIDGWTVSGSQTLLRRDRGALRGANVSGTLTRYADPSGGIAQMNNSLTLTATLPNLFSVYAAAGSTYLRTFDGRVAPFNQNGGGITYRGGTSTATSTSLLAGRYAAGSLTSWYNGTTFGLLRFARLGLEADRTRYAPDAAGEPVRTQWLERAVVDVQLSHFTSLDVGVRRIVGAFAPTSFFDPGALPVDAANITAALHFLGGSNELYVIYGDANTFTTSHAVFVKLIRYVGARKGS